jgi:hypothetical protein
VKRLLFKDCGLLRMVALRSIVGVVTGSLIFVGFDTIQLLELKRCL